MRFDTVWTITGAGKSQGVPVSTESVTDEVFIEIA